jgi:hypothetical protein
MLYYAAWQPWQVEIAAVGGADRRFAKNEARPMRQSRGAHYPAWPPHPPGRGAILELAPSSGEDPRPWWQTAWYLPRSTRTSPSPRSSGRPRGRVVLPYLHPSGVAAGHEPLTMDRQPSAVLTPVIAARATP